jgi:hypothetical protein
MSHEAYICYDERDKEVSEAIYQIFEENGIKTWIKSKDMSAGDPVDRITNAIEGSRCFVLIYSRNSKATNYVVTETDIAFSRNIPIIVFNIDDSSFIGNLEFILENQVKISAFPNYKKQLDVLVKKTSGVVKKPPSNVKINSKFLKPFEKINPKRKENAVKKYIKIAVPIVVVVILIYLFVILPTGQNTTEDGIFSMNITNVDVSGSSGSYQYTVFGESYNMPADSDKYIMNIKFFDKDENTIFEVNSTADEFKSGVICSCNLDDDNITHVGFKLTDLNNKILSKQDYAIA